MAANVVADEVEERIQRESRERAEYMRRMDRNGDGMISPDEVDGRGGSSFQRRVEAMGLDPSKPVALETYLGERVRMDSAEARGTEYKPQWHSDPSMKFGTTEKPAKAADFDKPITADERAALGMTSTAATAGGSGSNLSRQARAVDDKVRSYAKGILERYDDNKNGVLESDEAKDMRGGGERYDSNKDGKVTLDELTVVLAGFTSSSGGSDDNRSSSSSRDDSRRDDWRRDDSRRPESSDRRPMWGRRDDERSKETSNTSDNDKRLSYRFTPAIERLPKGTPSSFIDKDENEDGMVSMHEFASRWTSSEVAKFQELDLDNDGVITPAEAIAGRMR